MKTNRSEELEMIMKERGGRRIYIYINIYAARAVDPTADETLRRRRLVQDGVRKTHRTVFRGGGRCCLDTASRIVGDASRTHRKGLMGVRLHNICFQTHVQRAEASYKNRQKPAIVVETNRWTRIDHRRRPFSHSGVVIF